VPELLFYKASKLTKVLQNQNHLTALLSLNAKEEVWTYTEKVTCSHLKNTLKNMHIF